MPQDTIATPSSVPAVPPSVTEPVRLSWSTPAGMLVLSVVNFVLRIVTLGIYHFWGKTEVRRRIWSSVRINGEPLAYTGTGKELFLGFLVIFAIVVIPTLLVSVGIALFAGPNSTFAALFQTGMYVVFFGLTGVAVHRAQRYRLARTEWRGIRGGLDGSSLAYAWAYCWTAALIPLTLGWIIPWRTTRLQGLITNDMRFGNRKFHFDATSASLYPRFVGLWFGGIILYSGLLIALYFIFFEKFIRARVEGVPYLPAARDVALAIAIFLLVSLLIGLISAWYRAGMYNLFAAHTSYAGARFSGNADAPSLIWLTVTNFLLAFLTLGLLTPIAQMRSARYFVSRLTLTGELPLGEIMQGAEDQIRRGEGLAQAFDVDAF